MLFLTLMLVLTTLSFEPHITKFVMFASTPQEYFKDKEVFHSQATETVIHALVTSKLDYCNFLFYGLLKFLIAKLPAVPNSALCLVFKTRKFDHITPVLIALVSY